MARIRLYPFSLSLFGVYIANFRNLGTGDTIPARLLPFSLLLDGTLYLDRWANVYSKKEGKPPYWIRVLRGHWFSPYPVVGWFEEHGGQPLKLTVVVKP